MRRAPLAEEPLSRVRLRTGRELAVVNVSNAGLLVEGTVRLLPGMHVDVHVVTRDGRLLVRSRIVRAYVSELEAGAVRYRGALAFDRLVDTAIVGYALPRAFGEIAGSPGNTYPADLDSTPASHEERLTA